MIRFAASPILLAAFGCFTMPLASWGQPPPPTADQVLSYLGFDAGAKRDLWNGKIIVQWFQDMGARTTRKANSP